MSDIIRLLPDSVANQIAAGEVVQRPASVVKELLENSVDAGADRIELWLTDAGKSCIQVIDNGKGMSETDARLSFERHATSKIKEAKDLFDLHTMGFRGEALASIAAVAQVELKTRTANDEMGVSITMEGARCIDQHPVMCPVGANFAVRNLFFNVPARRRFLKSNITEMNNVMQEFERVALINNDKSFKVYKDDSLALDLKAGSFKQRILGLYGQSYDKQLLPLSVDTDIVKIEGFVGSVQSAKQKGYKQFFFVNGRYMRHPYFNKAVQAAFERLLPPEKQVSFFLRLTVDPQQIDVNIHPSKTEIKFEDERAIWQLLLVAVRDALGKYNAVPTIDFDNTLDIDIPSFGSGNGEAFEPTLQVNPRYNPFDSTMQSSRSSGGGSLRQSEFKKPSTEGWQDLYGSATKPLTAQPPVGGELAADDKTAPVGAESNRAFFRYSSRYIVTPAKSGLMVIDYVRAHRRILYDRFIQSVEKGDNVSQSLLFPEFVQLSLAQSYVMDNLLPQLNAMGFDIAKHADVSGQVTYAVSAVPAAVGESDVNALVVKLIEDYDKQGLKSEDLYHTLALAIAVSNSVSTDRRLDETEMASLVDDLFACKTPNYTPDGKVVITIISEEDVVKRFR